VWSPIEPKDTVAAVSAALEAGYRHIDTAEMYGNEAALDTHSAPSPCAFRKVPG
jgi:diketogulonate reductase-like aldo/keto reductase